MLRWAEPDSYFAGWPKGYMTWLCRCDAEVSVTWTASCSLYDSDDPIIAADAITDRWQVECHAGHVLLLCHEWAGVDESGDTFPAPTTAQIVERLASPEDVAAWRASWVKAEMA